ncbi:MAG TPA: hypothetical protein VHO02_00295 [Fibrobacteria bacterium]|nr:hypothetical protein [Fibrobacteria bacterium]
MFDENVTAVRGKLRAAVFSSAVSIGIAGFAMGTAGGLSACNGSSGRDSADASVERAAVLRVEAGDGRLSDGEEFVIAEWRSGARADDGSKAFADFRGQDGGPTLDLALSGLGAAGTYDCDGKGAASLRLNVDVNNEYRPDLGACRVTVDRVVNGVAEGRYAATLRHSENSEDVMKVSGTFRASASPEIAVAKAPKILGK